MCAVKRELSIDYAELNCLEVRCACGTIILIPTDHGDNFTTTNCPECRIQYGSNLGRAVQQLREVYRLFAMIQREPKAPRIGVRIPFTD